MIRYILLLFGLILSIQTYAQYEPIMTNELNYDGFKVEYDNSSRIPKFVYYKLTDCAYVVLSRGQFIQDESVYNCPGTWEYNGSGYDRGHLFAFNFTCNQSEADDCMIMTNICPMTSLLNRGTWRQLENFEYNNRDSDGIFCVSGCIYNKDSKSFNGIVIPDNFYKVIYDQTKGCIAFLVNQNSSGNIKDYIVSVDCIELLTGIDFFYQLPDDIENKIESNYSIDLWNF